MVRIFFLILATAFATPVIAQNDARLQRTEDRVSAVESRLSRVESKVRSASTAGVLTFLFGAFCALWAQNTGRSGWLWFFLGLIFSVITVLVVLAKNSSDIDRDRRGPRRQFNLQDFRKQ